MIDDLDEETIFAPTGRILAEGIEDELEETLSPDLGGMDVYGDEL